jgi:hypothetical protein
MWFLWKMRVDQTAAVSGRGVWEWQSQPMTYFDHPSQRPLAPEHELVASQLRELLLPEKVEGVPFAVVAAILVVFLLVIAPGDYVLLGAMGLRRYTWVFLAAMSLAFTWVTVKIADRTMGSGDYHRGLVFVDLIAGGRAARTSRFEMLFTATQRTVETTVDDALYVPLVERRDPASRRSGRTLPQLAEDEESAASPRTVADLPVYSGRVPAAYTIRQQMRQWSPVVSRETRFGGDIAAPAIGWDDFDPSAWTTLEGRKELAAIIGAAEPGARVY